MLKKWLFEIRINHYSTMHYTVHMISVRKFQCVFAIYW